MSFLHVILTYAMNAVKMMLPTMLPMMGAGAMFAYFQTRGLSDVKGLYIRLKGYHERVRTFRQERAEQPRLQRNAQWMMMLDRKERSTDIKPRMKIKLPEYW